MACGQKRVARLMRQAQLRSVRGYKRPRYRVGLPATAAPNRLQREFTVTLPNQVWVTDITYIRTHEGWLYLTAVIDLYSRMVVGWSMKPRMCSDLAIDGTDVPGDILTPGLDIQAAKGREPLRQPSRLWPHKARRMMVPPSKT